MTDAICYRDSYAANVDATVVASGPATAGQGATVVLDRTVFYPGGGGQPSDRGLLLRAADGRAWTVRAARKDGGEIVHELEPDAASRPRSATACGSSSSGLVATR